MWDNIEKEKRSAEHLLYVSMKYTKTCDVILNLISRWQSMINESLNALLEKARKKKLVKVIPIAPKMKIDLAKKIFAKEEVVQKTIAVFIFFKRIPQLEQFREHEFRKNVTLKILDSGKWVDINMDKLKEYNGIIERFITHLKQFL